MNGALSLSPLPHLKLLDKVGKQSALGLLDSALAGMLRHQQVLKGARQVVEHLDVSVQVVSLH